MAAQRWGWHRLDDRWARRVVAAAGVRPGELVLDLGAGDGALTAALVGRGATVTALELHPQRWQRLRERFADDPVRVVRADLDALRLPHRPFRVVANPPFSLMISVVRQLVARGSSLYAADLVLPRSYVAQVVAGRVPGGGRGFDFRRGLHVPPGAFRPPPAVDCAVLEIRRARLGLPAARHAAGDAAAGPTRAQPGRPGGG